ncbi:IS630 family transposase [Microdochium nivale]|nr:IS630 family transposase [Microdochium nivale]
MVQQSGIASRAHCTLLRADGLQFVEISRITGIKPRTAQKIYERACERGFDATARPLVLLDAWFEDAPRSGRPKKKTPEITTLIDGKVIIDLFSREKTCQMISNELKAVGHDVSPTTVWRIIREPGYRKTCHKKHLGWPSDAWS